MPVSNQRFIKPHLLMRLNTMELRARTVVEGFMSGLHRSPYRGLSMEFAEYRHYQPGDEPKRIDWRAYARSDKYYVREFEDESNLNALIVLDASASMGFGSGEMTKWQYGGTLAATLAYMLQSQKDGVGLVVLDEKVRFELPPKSTRNHLIQVIGEMEKTTPARGTRLAPALHYVASKIKRKGMVIVISDLLDDVEAVVDGLRHLQFGGSDVIVLHTLDPVEINFDFRGPMLFMDPESNQVMPALADDVKAGYMKAIEQFKESCSEAMGKTNIAYTLVDTSKPLDETLLAFLSMSARRR